MMKRETMKPIAMKCSFEQFNKIRPILEENDLAVYEESFSQYPYLTNNIGNELGVISNIHGISKDRYERKVFEEWNENVFLEYCGIETKVKNEEIELINPKHITLSSNGYGEFPDGYTLTDKGKKYILDSKFVQAEKIKAQIEENKSIFEMLKIHGTESAVIRIGERIKELEQQLKEIEQ